MPGGCYSAADSDDTKTRREAGGDTAWSRWSKLIAVCLLVLCVVLLIVVIVLLKENGDFKRELKQAHCERVDHEKFLKLRWTYSNSSVYIINTEQKSWTESRKNCRDKGADLVIINSREEQDFVNTLRGSNRAWIGLNKGDKENKWKWVDGTPLNTGFWSSGEQNSPAGEDRCVIIGETSDSVNWADYPCNEQYIWICEKKIFNSIAVCE